MENRNQPSDIFCLAPFFNAFYKGNQTSMKIAPCCESRNVDESFKSFNEYWESEYLKNIRQKMFNNEPHEICSRCVSLENAGGYSGRKNYNLLYSNIKKEIKSELHFSIEKGNDFNEVLVFDYRGNNLCNLKCRMCHPSSSSEIAKEMSIYTNEYDEFDLGDYHQYLFNKNKPFNDFIDSVPMNNVFRVKILGGEPLIQEDFYYVLNKIIKNGSSNKTILSLTTNGTSFPKKFFDLTKEFKKVHIRISLDGTGDIHNYIRSKGNWGTIIKNLSILKDNKLDNFRIGFSYVLQLYNIFNIIDILEFIKLHNNNKIWEMGHFFSPIEQDWLSTRILFDSDREIIINQLENYKNKDLYMTSIINEILTIINNYDLNRTVDIDNLRNKFKKYTLMQDKIRKTNLVKINENFRKYL